MRISSKCTGHSGVWLQSWDDLCRNSPENLPPIWAQLLRIVWFLPKLWYSNIVFPFFFEQGRRMWTNMLISAQCYGVLEVPDGFFCEKKGAPAPFIASAQVTGRLTLRQIKVHPLNGRPHCSVHFGLWNVMVEPKWMITLPETNTSHLKMDGWSISFGGKRPIFSGKLLVSGSVSSWIQIWPIPFRCQFPRPFNLSVGRNFADFRRAETWKHHITPQKSNVDTKNGHILKEAPFPNHRIACWSLPRQPVPTSLVGSGYDMETQTSFWVSMLIFGGVHYLILVKTLTCSH